VLLQLLDDGRLTDGQGRTVDFKNTVVVMTSNIGSQHFFASGLSPEQQREQVLSDVRATFRPEFLNRVDETVVFAPLGKDDIADIVDIQIDLLRRRLADRKLSVTLTPAARDHLAVKGYDPAFGARPLKRLIQREVQDALALKLLSGDIKEGDRIEVDAAGDGLEFRTSRESGSG
jgi:ATP-dependent Clp protease ATP-binding subunit ClpB